AAPSGAVRHGRRGPGGGRAGRGRAGIRRPGAGPAALDGHGRDTGRRSGRTAGERDDGECPRSRYVPGVTVGGAVHVVLALGIRVSVRGGGGDGRAERTARPADLRAPPHPGAHPHTPRRPRHPGRPEADDRETGPRTGTGTRAVEDLRPLPVVVHVGRTVRAGHEGTGDSVLPEPSAAQVPQRGTLCGPGPVSGVV